MHDGASVGTLFVVPISNGLVWPTMPATTTSAGSGFRLRSMLEKWEVGWTQRAASFGRQFVRAPGAVMFVSSQITPSEVQVKLTVSGTVELSNRPWLASEQSS